MRLLVTAISADKIVILEQTLEVLPHLFAAGRAGIARKICAAIGDELIEFIN